jgi:hypothetical protein
MRSHVLVMVLIGLICGSSAHAVKVYKWVDETPRGIADPALAPSRWVTPGNTS